MARGADDLLAVRLLDTLLEDHEVVEFGRCVADFVERCQASLARGGRIYVVCCGSSYHAAKAASVFFNELASTEVVAVIPGEFRGQYEHSLRDGDLFITISQSGETKDVIGRRQHVDRVWARHCPHRHREQRQLDLGPGKKPGRSSHCAADRRSQFRHQELHESTGGALLPGATPRRTTHTDPADRRGATCGATRAGGRANREIARPAAAHSRDRRCHGRRYRARGPAVILAPSIHLLATRITAVAKEGALKIREVVLNHTEGFEGSEFKHGPNTILGFNTLFGPDTAAALIEGLSAALDKLLEKALRKKLPDLSIRHLVQNALEMVFSPAPQSFALSPSERELLRALPPRDELLKVLMRNYPLIYITGPDERDVNLTVSQINTHKIRWADTVVIAEEHPALRQAAEKAPADNPTYTSVVIALPRTGDTMMTMFSATVVVQLLALKMSQLKTALPRPPGHQGPWRAP